MALTLVTTVAGASSNAYADETYYDSYFESVLYFTATWSAFTDEQKKARIIKATEALDVMVPEYKGTHYVDTQALEFPRDLGSDRFPESSIHARVKNAVGELIMFQYYKQSTTDGSIDSNEIQKVSAVNGLANVEYRESNFKTTSNNIAGGSIERARGLMQPWIGSRKLLRT